MAAADVARSVFAEQRHEQVVVGAVQAAHGQGLPADGQQPPVHLEVLELALQFGADRRRALRDDGARLGELLADDRRPSPP